MNDKDKQDTIKWLEAQVTASSISAVARRASISQSTISRLISGQYSGDVDGMLEKIAEVRRVEQERSAHVIKVPFCETSLARAVCHTCDRVRLFGHLSRVIGRSQIGKTWALRRYAESHPNTYYLEMPNRPTVGALVAQLCRQVGAAYRALAYQAREELAPKLGSNSLIIVDECQQATYRGKAGVCGPLEWLRQIHDATGCGMALVGTPEFDQATRSGSEARTLEQICKRGRAEYLNPLPTMGDIRLVCSHFGLDAPSGSALKLVQDMVSRIGLGEFCRAIEVVAYNARYRQQELSWEVFAEDVRLQEERARKYAVQ